jgi:hypothetical protein
MTTAVKATPNIHPRTHAAHTNTPTTATPRSAPSIAQVLADQKADQVIDRAGNIRESQAIAPSPAAPPRITAEPQLPVPSIPVSEEAFERNLANWGSGSGVPLVFNGLEGKFQTTGGEEVDVENGIFAAHLDETRKGWIKFNGEGEPPTTVSVGIMEDAQLPTREELGDLDSSLWDTDKFRGEPMDPWQQEIRVPIVSAAADGTIYELTSRSLTALYAIRGLLERYGRHPQRKKGLVPLIQLQVGSYYNNKLGTDTPKPVYRVVGWVQKDGSAPPTPNNVTTGALFNDSANL